MEDSQYSIQLDELDWKRIHEVALRRQGPKEVLDTTRKLRTTDASSLGAHQMGVAGELVFAKWSGLPLDESYRPGGDGGTDFRFGACTIDAQATYYQPAFLKFDAQKPMRADVAVAVELLPTGGQLVGWIDRLSFEKEAKDRSIKGKPKKILEALRVMPDLWPWLKANSKT